MLDAEALALLRADSARPPLVQSVFDHALAAPSEWAALSNGRALRRLRMALGLRQAEAAELCGMTQSQIGKIERGLDMRLSTLRRLLEGYGCRLVWLPVCELSVEELYDRTEARFGSREEKRLSRLRKIRGGRLARQSLKGLFTLNGESEKIK